jgi:hypothetical protein
MTVEDAFEVANMLALQGRVPDVEHAVSWVYRWQQSLKHSRKRR